MRCEAVSYGQAHLRLPVPSRLLAAVIWLALVATGSAAQSKPWWVIQDASGDVVALCDNGGPTVATGLSPTGAGGAATGPATIHTGRVVQQFTYDAYGAVLAAEQVVDNPNFVIPNLRVGHKGLFADRLDVGITTSGTDPPSGLANLDTSGGEHLVRHASVVYHVRNRIYLPALGVWGQSDPNGTGQPVLASGAMHGMGPDALLGGIEPPDVKTHYGDGVGTHGYLSASPLMQADPLGLLPTPWEAAGAAINVGIGAVRGGLEGMTSQYAANMESDLDWAMDWSRGDDEHSRGDNAWVSDAYDYGMRYGAKQAALDELWGLIDPFGLMQAGLDYVTEGGLSFAQKVKAGAAPGRKALGRPHGGPLHQQKMMQQVHELQAGGVLLPNVRTNQALVDPIKGTRLSNKRPDVQGFKKPNTIYIREACVSQSASAAKAKWIPHEVNRLRGFGYRVDFRTE